MPTMNGTTKNYPQPNLQPISDSLAKKTMITFFKNNNNSQNHILFSKSASLRLELNTHKFAKFAYNENNDIFMYLTNTLDDYCVKIKSTGFYYYCNIDFDLNDTQITKFNTFLNNIPHNNIIHKRTTYELQ